MLGTLQAPLHELALQIMIPLDPMPSIERTYLLHVFPYFLRHRNLRHLRALTLHIRPSTAWKDFIKIVRAHCEDRRITLEITHQLLG